MSETTSFDQLWAEIKSYINLELEMFKINGVEKASRLVASFIIAIFLALMLNGVLLVLLFALAYAIAGVLGSLALAFLAIAILYLLIAWMIYLLRKPLVFTPTARILSRLFITSNPQFYE